MPFARKLKKRITVQSVTQSQDARGGPIDTFSTYAIRWAEARPVTGREYFANSQVQSQANIWFKLRYDDKTKAITTKHRVSYDGRFFDIESVVNVDEANIEIVLFCLERH